MSRRSGRRAVAVALAIVTALSVVRAPAQAAPAEHTITMSAADVDPGVLRGVIDDIEHPDKTLSQEIQDYYRGLGQAVPAGMVDFDGDIELRDGLLRVTVASEVAISDRSWWVVPVSVIIGLASMAVFGAACLGLATALGAVPLVLAACPPLAAALGAGLTELVKTALSGDPLNAKAWYSIAWAALAAFLATALIEVAVYYWAKEFLAPALQNVGNRVVATVKAVAAYFKFGTSGPLLGLLRGLRVVFEGLPAIIRSLGRTRGFDVPGIPLRVLPLGDSITAGVASSTLDGFRDALRDDLVEGVREVDFVGSQRSGAGEDPDHEGHSGDTIEQISDTAHCAVRRYRPNVVTLHAGTNDIDQRHELDTAPQRVGSLVDRILADAPETTVLVAKLIPATKAGMQPLIDAFNAGLEQVVEQRRAAGKRVWFVDTGDVTTKDLAQPAHPSDRGYRKLADAFFFGVLAAESRDWVRSPVAGNPNACGVDQAGPGWQSLGVITAGMSTPGRTDVVELNGDDRGDYVRIADDGSVRAALNMVGEPGRPNWVDQGVIVPPRRAGFGERVRFADVTGDGRDDYLEVGDAADVRAWRNDGPGAFFGAPLGVIAPGVSGAVRDAIRFADVDGDRRDDYLRTSDAGAVHAYRNTVVNGSIHWVEWLNWAPGVSYGTRDKLRLADVTGDRRADYLMVGAEGNAHAYFNQGGRGHGGFGEHLHFAWKTYRPGDKVVFRDISGDGRADYLVIYQGGSIRAWLNRGGNDGPDTCPGTTPGDPGGGVPGGGTGPGDPSGGLPGGC